MVHGDCRGTSVNTEENKILKLFGKSLLQAIHIEFGKNPELAIKSRLSQGKIAIHTQIVKIMLLYSIYDLPSF